MVIRRRPFYADGFSWAVGVCPYMPTGAVGIDMAVGKTSFSGSEYSVVLEDK
ncbi:hypothetical protein ACQJBY_069909 [Aegilops geniculata]